MDNFNSDSEVNMDSLYPYESPQLLAKDVVRKRRPGNAPTGTTKAPVTSYFRDGRKRLKVEADENSEDISLQPPDLLLSGGVAAFYDQDDTHEQKNHWSVEQSDQLYHITEGWGYPYFSVNQEGNVTCDPSGSKNFKIDMYKMIEDVLERGHDLPLIIRFTDILMDRVRLLNTAFAKAIALYKYDNVYRGVYPIKVCQHKQVVEDIVKFGKDFKYGLEAGSKPELLIVLAELKTKGALITCNGYKDAEYLETALLAQRLGQIPIVIIEKLHEIDMVLEASKKLGIKPIVGARAKLSSRGIGRWGGSTGDKAKFGLSAAEILILINTLKKNNMLDSLQLLHFHIGSQISDISKVKNALREAGQYYVQIKKMGANMKYIDVGGGLGVDYDGSKTSYEASINYTVDEYAADVVVAIQDICKKHGIPVPVIISESGRAISSHHSVLVFNVNSARTTMDKKPDPSSGLYSTSTSLPIISKKDDHELTVKLSRVLKNIDTHNLQESLHDSRQCREDALSLFSLGLLSLSDRAKVEELYWCCINDIYAFSKELDVVPSEVSALKELLSSTYYCDMSVFKSAPDTWAIDQCFPICPIHRLAEEPTVFATLADCTFDSEGKIDNFIDASSGSFKGMLELHPLKSGEKYMLGMFLSGAYQEVLGSFHNLYGDTNVVHVYLDEEDSTGYRIENIIPGDSIQEVLAAIGKYETNSLLESIRMQSERALKSKELTLHQYKTLVNHFDTALRNYTYFTSEEKSANKHQTST